jgi:hypothetical protein
VLALLASSACGTEPPAHATSSLLVAVWTDLEIPVPLERIEASLRQGPIGDDASRPLDPRGQAQPIVLRLEAAAVERGRPVDLTIIGFAGDLALVQRRARLPRLPPGESVLAIPLEARCAGRDCGPDWTCMGGSCERVELAIEVLAGSVDDLADPLAGVAPGRRVDGCDEAADCDDGDPCTVDLCTAHQCHGDGWMGECVRCGADPDCSTLSAACIEAYCHPYGVCRQRTLPPGTRCDDDEDPCTVQCCREGDVCMSFEVCSAPDVATGCDP